MKANPSAEEANPSAEAPAGGETSAPAPAGEATAAPAPTEEDIDDSYPDPAWWADHHGVNSTPPTSPVLDGVGTPVPATPSPSTTPTYRPWP